MWQWSSDNFVTVPVPVCETSFLGVLQFIVCSYKLIHERPLLLRWSNGDKGLPAAALAAAAARMLRVTALAFTAPARADKLLSTSSFVFHIAVSVGIKLSIQNATLLRVLKRGLQNLIGVRLLRRFSVCSEHSVPKRGIPAHA